MKTALVIPTLNAMRLGFWPEALSAVNGQSLQPDLKLVVDSSSDDQTRELAKAHGWRVLRHSRGRFNHGLTRTRIVRALAHLGYDAVVFLSQDVVLASPDSLKTLLGFLVAKGVAGCYGKQVSRHEHSYNAWQRMRSYPDASGVKTLDDVSRLGVRTVSFSNAFSAWRIGEVMRSGGFPDTDFGEDMLLVAKMVLAGKGIGYCAEAIAFHDHGNGPVELFARGYVNGRFFYRNRELFRKFGSVTRYCSPHRVWLRIVPLLAIKGLGFAVGTCVAMLIRERPNS